MKSGVGSDLYNVTARQAAAAAALGGGSNLNNAYSAMSTVPGVQVNIGGAGWNFNAAYVRGQNQYYTGYEYDGIPINRAFDNYNGSTESSLGLQELQVYTGGGPGFGCQRRHGRFHQPGHQDGNFPRLMRLQISASGRRVLSFGASRSRRRHPGPELQLLCRISGNNQAFRFLNSQNGASLMTPGGIYSGPTLGPNPVTTPAPRQTVQGDKPSCPLAVTLRSAELASRSGCWVYYNGISALPSLITDREDIVNFHIGIPKHNGLRDDIQLMWSASALNNYSYSSPNDIGTSVNQFT